MNPARIRLSAIGKKNLTRLTLITAMSILILPMLSGIGGASEGRAELPTYSQLTARPEENLRILSQVILQQGAEEPQARFLRGYYFLGEGRYGNALEDFTHPSVLNSPMAPIAQIAYAQWLIFSGEYGKANTMLEPLKTNGAYKKFVIPLLFDSALYSGDIDSAVSIARISSSEKPRYLARLAEKYENIGCLTEAEALIREILASYPLSAESRRYEDWIDEEKFAKTLSDAFWRERAKALFQRGLYKDAMDALSNIKKIAPEDRELEGTALYRRKLYSRAIRAFDEIQTPKAMYISSVCYEKLHNPLMAKVFCENAFNFAIYDEWWAKAGFELAKQYETNGDSEKVITILEYIGENAERTDDKVRSLWEVALRAIKSGDYGRATDALKKYLQSPGLHIEERLRGEYWLARLQERAGAYQDAIFMFSRLSVEFPDHYYGQRSAQRHSALRAVAAPNANNYKMKQLEFLPINKKAPVIAILLQMGLVGEARLILEETVRFAPSDYDYGILLARLYLSEGDFRSAMKVLNNTVQNTSLTWRMIYEVIPQELLKKLYPIDFKEIILKYSKKEKLDPLLVCAIIYQESLFDSNALSHAGARGLMQIIPPTGRAIARERKERWTTSGLYDPRRSVDYGTYYFSGLLKRFEGRVELALAGYNGGPNRVSRWWNDAQGDTELFVDSITLSETRQYVKKILTHYERYKLIYKGEFN